MPRDKNTDFSRFFTRTRSLTAKPYARTALRSAARCCGALYTRVRIAPVRSSSARAHASRASSFAPLLSSGTVTTSSATCGVSSSYSHALCVPFLQAQVPLATDTPNRLHQGVTVRLHHHRLQAACPTHPAPPPCSSARGHPVQRIGPCQSSSREDCKDSVVPSRTSPTVLTTTIAIASRRRHFPYACNALFDRALACGSHAVAAMGPIVITRPSAPNVSAMVSRRTTFGNRIE